MESTGKGGTDREDGNGPGHRYRPLRLGYRLHPWRLREHGRALLEGRREQVFAVIKAGITDADQLCWLL